MAGTVGAVVMRMNANTEGAAMFDANQAKKAIHEALNLKIRCRQAGVMVRINLPTGTDSMDRWAVRILLEKTFPNCRGCFNIGSEV